MTQQFKSKTVSYFYDDEIGNFSYGGGNPMRPHRVRLTHSLVESYGLLDNLILHRPAPQDPDSIAVFHADGELFACYLLVDANFLRSYSRGLTPSSSISAEYVDFLGSVTPDNQDEYMTQLRRFNLGPAGEADCPVFDGLFEYCQVRL